MKTLFAFLLLAGTASAQVTTDQLIWPAYGGTHAVNWWSPANQMRCWRIPARLGVSGATKIALGINVGGGSSGFNAVCGVAIYDDDNAGARLVSATFDCVDNGMKQASVSAFSMVQGTTYRVCACSNKSSGQYAALAEHAAVTMNKMAVLNAGGTVRVGHAASLCSNGTPPTTTGALTIETVSQPPTLDIER